MIPSSIAEPVRVIQDPKNIEELEKDIKQLIINKNPALYSFLNEPVFRLNGPFLKDLINSVEIFLKDKTTDPEEKFKLTLIFNTIKTQLQLIETFKFEDSQQEALLCATFFVIFNHFKKLFS